MIQYKGLHFLLALLNSFPYIGLAVRWLNSFLSILFFLMQAQMDFLLVLFQVTRC